MKCPKCNIEMEKGFIQTDGTIITWVKKKHKMFILPSKDEVRLGEHIFDGPCIPADICKNCKNVIVDYSNSNYFEA